MLELLAKCEDSQTKTLHNRILKALDEAMLCARSRFTCKQIKTLLKAHTNTEILGPNQAFVFLVKHRNRVLPETLRAKKQHLIHTFLGANFPEKKHLLEASLQAFEQALSPVEEKMYGLLRLYLSSLDEAVELFVLFDTSREASFEGMSTYVASVHEGLIEDIFYKEERVLVEEGLGKMGLVLSGVYYQHLYM